MIININKTVSYAVANVEARSVIFNLIPAKDHSATLNITFPFSWLDSKNQIIHRGTNRYSESQMTQLFASKQLDFTPLASTIKGMLPITGQYPNVAIHFLDSGKFSGSISHQEKQNDGTYKWITIPQTQAMLENALIPSGYNLAQIKAIVTGFVVETTV